VTVRSGKTWTHPRTGTRLDLNGLIAMLNEEASRLAAKLGGSIRLTAKGIDLRPRLQTERAATRKPGRTTPKKSAAKKQDATKKAEAKKPETKQPSPPKKKQRGPAPKKSGSKRPRRAILRRCFGSSRDHWHTPMSLLRNGARARQLVGHSMDRGDFLWLSVR